MLLLVGELFEQERVTLVSPLLLEELECSEQSFVSYAHRRKDIFGQVFGSLWQVVIDVVEVILIANTPVSDQLVESQSERSHCLLLVVHLRYLSVTWLSSVYSLLIKLKLPTTMTAGTRFS